MEYAISKIAVMGFFTVAALYFLFRAWLCWRLKKYGVKTTAVIIGRDMEVTGYSRKLSGAQFYTEYEFTAQGQQYRRKSQNYNKQDFLKYADMQEIEVIYDPKNPKSSCIAEKLPNRLTVMLLFFAGCCYIVLKIVT